MAKVYPFRGVRYNKALAEDLSQVVTQPYDRIGPKELEIYLSRSPYNFVRLIGTKIPPQDEADYAHRAKLFRTWLRDGVLVQDEEPGIYAYHVLFSHDGEEYTRRGIIVLLDLRESKVKAHERTLRGPKEDRLKLIRSCEAQLEHIFLLYQDPERRVNRAVDQAIAGSPPDMEAMDDFGNVHRLWHVPTEATIRAVQETLAPLELYIADGHHRFETSWAFMEECLSQGWRPLEPESFTSIPVTLVNTAEPGCVIRPTPRVVHSLPNFDLDKFLRDVADNFHIEPIASFEEAKQRLRAAIGVEHVFVAYSAGRFWILSLRPGANLDQLIPGDHSPAWKRLDVTILHKVILEPLLGIDDEALARQANVDYTHTFAEALTEVDKGKGQIAFLLNPTRVEEVLNVANCGEPMPQKSTDFYPKLLSGLVAMKMEIEKPHDADLRRSASLSGQPKSVVGFDRLSKINYDVKKKEEEVELREVEIGEVTNFFRKIGVAAIKIHPGQSLKVGDRIVIRGPTTHIEQIVESLEINRQRIIEAKGGEEVGLLIRLPEEEGPTVPRKGNKVFKVEFGGAGTAWL